MTPNSIFIFNSNSIKLTMQLADENQNCPFNQDEEDVMILFNPQNGHLCSTYWKINQQKCAKEALRKMILRNKASQSDTLRAILLLTFVAVISEGVVTRVLVWMSCDAIAQNALDKIVWLFISNDQLNKTSNLALGLLFLTQKPNKEHQIFIQPHGNLFNII